MRQEAKQLIFLIELCCFPVHSLWSQIVLMANHLMYRQKACLWELWVLLCKKVPCSLEHCVSDIDIAVIMLFPEAVAAVVVINTDQCRGVWTQTDWPYGRYLQPSSAPHAGNSGSLASAHGPGESDGLHRHWCFVVSFAAVFSTKSDTAQQSPLVRDTSFSKVCPHRAK